MFQDLYGAIETNTVPKIRLPVRTFQDLYGAIETRYIRRVVFCRFWFQDLYGAIETRSVVAFCPATLGSKTSMVRLKRVGAFYDTVGRVCSKTSMVRLKPSDRPRLQQSVPRPLWCD